MQTSTQESRVLEMARHMGLLRARDVTASGLPLQPLKRLVDRGQLVRLGRGVYMLPEGEVTEHHDLAEACKRVPGGVVCLSSALQFHGITTQMPSEVWLMVQTGAWRPRTGDLSLRTFHATGPVFTEGIEEHVVEGVTVRVYSVAKTVADCFRYRGKIGLDVALEALRDCLRQRRAARGDIVHYARICRVERVMRPYIEALSVTT